MTLLIIISIFVVIFSLVFIATKKNYSIGTQKSRLLEMLSSIQSDITVDTKDLAIEPKNIIDIRTSILYLSNEIESYTKNIKKN